MLRKNKILKFARLVLDANDLVRISRESVSSINSAIDILDKLYKSSKLPIAVVITNMLTNLVSDYNRGHMDSSILGKALMLVRQAFQNEKISDHKAKFKRVFDIIKDVRQKIMKYRESEDKKNEEFDNARIKRQEEYDKKQQDLFEKQRIEQEVQKGKQREELEKKAREESANRARIANRLERIEKERKKGEQKTERERQKQIEAAKRIEALNAKREKEAHNALLKSQQEQFDKLKSQANSEERAKLFSRPKASATPTTGKESRAKELDKYLKEMAKTNGLIAANSKKLQKPLQKHYNLELKKNLTNYISNEKYLKMLKEKFNKLKNGPKDDAVYKLPNGQSFIITKYEVPEYQKKINEAIKQQEAQRKVLEQLERNKGLVEKQLENKKLNPEIKV